MKTPGKTNLPNLIGGLALLACAALSGLLILLPGAMRLGEIRKLDGETRRIVIRQIEAGKSAGTGLLLSSAIDAGLDIACPSTG